MKESVELTGTHLALVSKNFSHMKFAQVSIYTDPWILFSYASLRCHIFTDFSMNVEGVIIFWNAFHVVFSIYCQLFDKHNKSKHSAFSYSSGDSDSCSSLNSAGTVIKIKSMGLCN